MIVPRAIVAVSPRAIGGRALLEAFRYSADGSRVRLAADYLLRRPRHATGAGG